MFIAYGFGGIVIKRVRRFYTPYVIQYLIVLNHHLALTDKYYTSQALETMEKSKDHPEIRKMCLAQRNVVLFGVPHLDQERRDLWPKLDILLKSYGYSKGFYKDKNEDHSLIVDVSYKFKNLNLTGRVLSVYENRSTRIRSIPHKEELVRFCIQVVQIRMSRLQLVSARG